MSDLNDLNKYVDESISKQDDFFTYVNGKWLEQTEIPEDKARWGSFIILAEKSIHDVKSLLETNEFNDADFKKIKKFYNEGMNIKRRNELDYKPVKEYLDRINAIETKEQLVSVLLLFAEKNLASVFGCGSTIDRKNSSQEVPHLYSSGLSIAHNKDYYTDPDKQEIRNKFVEYITTLFTFIGLTDPEKKAKVVLKFETQLAEKHFTQVQKRDPELTYNDKQIGELEGFVSNFNWKSYFNVFSPVEITKVVLDNPNYFTLIDSLLGNPNLEEWKVYLTARLLNGEAPFLSERFVQANF